jgi:dihydrofolate reductase
MAKTVFGMTMSLDGFVNDRNGDVGALFHDLGELGRTHGLQKAIASTGAVVMGRRAYDMAQGGDWTDYEFQAPIFVLTHRAPEKPDAGRTFTFVTDGVESAMRQARAAAGDKDVMVVGGANTGQQLLGAGLVDELHISIMPVLLGKGLRLFEHLNAEEIRLEPIQVDEVLSRTEIRFRVLKGDGTPPTAYLERR